MDDIPQGWYIAEFVLAETQEKLIHVSAKIGSGFVLMQVQNKDSSRKQDRGG